MAPGRHVRALTPKEFSEAIGGLLSTYTVREKCRTGEFSTVNGPHRPPYFIRPEVLARFRRDVSHLLVA